MNISELNNLLKINSKDLGIEFRRLFHGRGNLYDGWSFLTIDSIDDILSVAFYKEIDIELETKLLEMLKEFILDSRHTTTILQRRYVKGTSTEILVGVLKDEIYAIENGVKIKLNLLTNQNNGYFPDMKNGREFVKNNSRDKNVLNLFSYTCAFSVSAMIGGAKSVCNYDMSKSALTTGRTNHHINNIDTYNVKFYPHNILKSFSRIKRDSPYDLIIIDPPSLQKGSFEATKDYNKIIKRLEQISSKDCVVLACLNSPDLDVKFIIDIFKEEAPTFEYIKRLENLKEFPCIDENRSLKNIVFKRKI